MRFSLLTLFIVASLCFALGSAFQKATTKPCTQRRIVVVDTIGGAVEVSGDEIKVKCP